MARANPDQLRARGNHGSRTFYQAVMLGCCADTLSSSSECELGALRNASLRCSGDTLSSFSFSQAVLPTYCTDTASPTPKSERTEERFFSGNSKCYLPTPNATESNQVR